MGYYVHELSEMEVACGVTLEQVQEVLLEALVRDGRVYLPTGTPPALAGSVARCALGSPAKFVGMAPGMMPIYEEDNDA